MHIRAIYTSENKPRLKVAPYNFHSNRKIHSLGHISDK